MASLPSPTQVAGTNINIYEAYYSVVDPNGYGTVGGLEAARFLKRSGLSDVILSRIWDLSDPGGRGSLDKSGMFVALKLVALVQNGKDLNLSSLNEDVPPPKMGDVPIPKTKLSQPSQLITSLPPSAVDWTIKPSERENYDKLFDSLQPLDGLIPGNKVKNVLMDSKLPFDTLGKIWDLADQDKDGMLNRHEFVVAMHLVYKALEKYAIPNTLPPELMQPLKDSDVTPLTRQDMANLRPEVPPPPTSQAVTKPIQSVAPTVGWVVTPEEKTKSDALFLKSDVDKDGFVSGGEIKDVFLRSGVPQQVLAHIWSLCDIKETGKLNNEQFALAMWFVARSLKGMDPPPSLTPEMVPPSFRSIKSTDGVLENNNTRYSNPELDMISKDIKELYKEKLSLETDIAQKEAEIKIKSVEISNLQSEYNTLATTLKQLENQKGEAQKRLNDLKTQVDKLRTQALEQSKLVESQETELKTKKEQLEGLKLEEQHLEQQKNDSLQKLESMTTKLQETQLYISQAKALITQLQEQTRQINDAITLCDVAVNNNNADHVPDTVLRIKPDFKEAEHSNFGIKTEKQNGFTSDPFSCQNGPTNNSFGTPKNDPFKLQSSHSDAFNTAFQPAVTDEFASGNFETNFSPSENDPFTAFDSVDKKSTVVNEHNKDAFGCDPFAVLHAPTRDTSTASSHSTGPPPRPSSPSPALPPKKSKQPPPRPAPPRPSLPPTVKKQPDLFGGDPFNDNIGGNGGFADFSNFESKFSSNDSVPSSKAASMEVQRKGLDFTDDPFRDYRYEDPSHISFDDEETAHQKQNGKSSSLNEFNSFTNDATKLDVRFNSVHLGGRQSVPLPKSPGTLQVFFSEGGRASASLGLNLLSEDQQIAWAAKESLKAEEERQKQRQKEEAELELALSLSKIDVKKR